MKRRLWVLVPLLALGFLAACGKESRTMTKFVFDRGHGSAWGNQLYIEICPEEITLLRQVGEDGALQTKEHLPITGEDWRQLEGLLEDVTLEKPPAWKRLFTGNVKDGGLYRRLTITYDGEQISYWWPENGDALEHFLEQLAREAAQ